MYVRFLPGKHTVILNILYEYRLEIYVYEVMYVCTMYVYEIYCLLTVDIMNLLLFILLFSCIIHGMPYLKFVILKTTATTKTKTSIFWQINILFSKYVCICIYYIYMCLYT